METTSIASGTTGTNSGSLGGVLNAKNKTMGKEAFLSMLVAQLKNQDPLNPMEGTDFTAQLAQFSSLEQMMDVNKNIKSLQLLQTSQNNSMLTSMIGKNIEALGSTTTVKDGAASDLSYEIDAASASIDVNIYNSNGTQVRSFTEDGKGKGKHSSSWDGKGNAGSTLADGDYSYTVSAKDGSGAKIGSREFISGNVTAISFDESGNSRTWIGPLEVPVKNIIKIGNN